MSEALKPIPSLLSDMVSTDAAIAGPASRELLRRCKECVPFLAELCSMLQNQNAAVADVAFRTLERFGKAAVPDIVNQIYSASGTYRLQLLSLLSAAADIETVYPFLKDEIENGAESARYWAANCLGRLFTADAIWSNDKIDTLKNCIELLIATKQGELRDKYWMQARMTLKHLGLIQNNHSS